MCIRDRVDSAADVRKFHDLSTFSRGLLTNVATGGWRKDISLLTEQYEDLPTSDLSSFTIEPGVEETFDRATPSSFPDSALIYPWASYRNVSGESRNWSKVPPICSWTALTDYALQYKNLTTSSASNTAMDPHAAELASSARFDFQEKVRRIPVIARIQWILSLCAREAPEDSDGDSDDDSNDDSGPPQFQAGLQITPVLTLWNPYNVELEMNSYEIEFSGNGVIPVQLSVRAGTQTSTASSFSAITSTSDVNNSNAQRNRLRLLVDSAFTLAPGATRTFSTQNVEDVDTVGERTLRLSPGYEIMKGFRFFNINNGAPLLAGRDDVLDVLRVEYPSDRRTNAIEIDYNVIVDTPGGGDQSSYPYRMGYTESELGGANIVNDLYPPITTSAGGSTLGELAQDERNATPFASAIYAFRLASPISNQSKHAHQRTKGMLQANPLTHYTELGNEDNVSGVTQSNMANTGIFHPINAPFDFAFTEVNGWTGNQAVAVEDGTNSSFIISGLAGGTGLTRCVVAELPTRPLQSLAQLQHFDVRNGNHVPPFQFNIIGNGSAHPIFEPDQVAIPTGANSGYVNDDAYILNHLFFDDWFVSSIAPDLADFSNREDRDLETVYQEHLDGTTPLPNRFYLPARDADEDAVATEQDSATGLYTYQTIASQLEVDGMFNVNSVSVDAWKAILSHNRDAEVPYLSANGSTDSSSDGGVPYPRTSIAGDESTESGSRESNSASSDAVKIAGYTALTDVQIDALAEEIVAQIRERGPFLSLSEFVNRQLTRRDDDLAIASTIQKALDNLSETGNSPENPYADIQSAEGVFEITSQPPGNTEYGFPEAALGSTAFGFPSWIRQADILTPLAPILTVRDDTFTIRAYGDARDKEDSDTILATAWCEATVQRQSDYLDTADSNEIAPYSSDITSETNNRYGRRYEIVSFRWLNKEEI